MQILLYGGRIMRITHQIHLLLYKIKQRVFGTQIDKIRRGGGTIGTNVHILGSYIDPLFPFLITIGDNTTLTDVKILAHDASTNKQLGFTKIGKVSIGTNCFIGAKTLILPGVTIGDRVIVGAGSVVTKDIPSNTVAVGNPCRVIKSYDEYMKTQSEMMNQENTIHKAPAKLTEEEKEMLKNQMKGIWYIK